MRVISQDGKMDIPYERFVFSTSKDNCVVASAQPVGSPRELYQGIMAKYSTEKKALKALEMCREYYSVHCSTLVREHLIFQFPKDEDIV